MYNPIRINQIVLPIRSFDQGIMFKLKGIRSNMGIKGGFAREIYKVASGISTVCSLEKMSDLDIVVFETQKENRNARILRREIYSRTISSVHPKDLEFIPSGLPGLKHYFLTRDVTMNEIVVFWTNDHFVIYYSDEAFNDIRERIIRPSVHCAHSGLGQVWCFVNDKMAIHPNITRRCLYRKIKGDGDVYDFGSFDVHLSIALFDEDAIYKTIKRFSHSPDLLEKSFFELLDFGFEEDMVQKATKKCQDLGTNPKPELTSEKVEDIIDQIKADHEQWLVKHFDEVFRKKADVLIS